MTDFSSLPAEDNDKKPKSTNRYVMFLFQYRYSIVILSWIFILIGMYVGKDAFSNLRDGGFSAPNAESTVTKAAISRNLIYPDYSITLLVKGNTEMTTDTSTFQKYYNQVKENLATKAPVVGVIGCYDYPELNRMFSTDHTQALMYATIAGQITNAKLNDIVNITPLTVEVGGGYPLGNELSEEILAGVELAEFGSLPIIIFLLIITLGGLIAGILPFYVAFVGIFGTLTLLQGFNQIFRISGIAASITTMFGLGLAIDYSLFIISRFMKERK